MLITILGVLVFLLVMFLVYVSRKPETFYFEKNGLIEASSEKIFPFISRLDLCGKWSPYEMRDLEMKKTFEGTDGVPGASMTFVGKPSSGTGKIEIVNVKQNEMAEYRLVMTKPLKCDNVIRYSLSKEGNSTKFTWSMEGKNRFINKLMITLIDCEKMLNKDMSEGIRNLKKVVE